MCGLKDFYSNGNAGPSTKSMKKEPKLASVVGILGHLASQHIPQIQQAIVSLFQVIHVKIALCFYKYLYFNC